MVGERAHGALAQSVQDAIMGKTSLVDRFGEPCSKIDRIEWFSLRRCREQSRQPAMPRASSAFSSQCS